MLYKDKFYSERDERTRAAASRIIAIIRSVHPFTSIIDVGCGVGTWLSAALDQGATRAVGIEGPWLSDSHVPDDRLTIHRQDLSQPIRQTERFDFALSLEVGEHLPQSRADSLVAELCALAPCILFGAAMPGQTGGVGHINLQWQGWWADKFRSQGLVPVDLVRPAIWHETAIPLWYRQNPILYVQPALLGGLGVHPCADRFIADIVHPEMFLRSHARRSPLRKILHRLRGRRS